MKLKFKNLKKKLNSKSYQNRNGFTIVELLVGMTITLVIVGLLLSMTKIAIGAWQVSNNKVKASRLANEVFEIVGRDLEGLVIRSGNSFEWFDISENVINGEVLGPNPAEIINNSLELNFFTATPDRYNGQIESSPGGDVSLVRYRLAFQDIVSGPDGEKPVYSLYRARVEPDVVFTNLLAESNLSTALETLGQSDSIRDVQNILADNIYDFTIGFTFEFTIDDGTKVFERVTVQVGGSDNALSIKGDDILIGADRVPIQIPDGAAAPRIASADISIFVLSDIGMKKLNVPGRPALSSAEFGEFLDEHGTSYTKSVLLPQP